MKLNVPSGVEVYLDDLVVCLAHRETVKRGALGIEARGEGQKKKVLTRLA